MKLRELRVTYHATPIPTLRPGSRIVDAKSAAAILVPLLENQAQEVLGALMLNAQHQPVGWYEIARGGLASVQMDLKVLFRAVLAASASAIVLAHNHPSGDPQPSLDDIAMTRAVIAAGKLLEVEVLDHLVIGDQRYISLKEFGVI